MEEEGMGAGMSHRSGGVGCTKGRAGFPLGGLSLGRSPFFLLASVCAAVPPGDTWREGLAGTLLWLPLVWKLGQGEQHRLPPWISRGLLVPGALRGHCPPQREQPGTRAWDPCGCGRALLQRQPFAAWGKGRPVPPPPPRQLRNTKRFPWDQCPFPP